MILLPFAITFPSIFISTASSVSGSIPLRDIFSESFNVKVSPDFVSLGVVNETSYPKASPSPAISFPSSSVLSVFSLTTGLMMLFEISFDSVSPAWRAFGSGFSFNSSSSFATSFDAGSACVSVFSTLAASVSSTFSSSTIASLSSSDFNASLFFSAVCVVSSVLFSFSSAATVSSILASLLAFGASISSFLETSFVSASSSATGSNFSSDTAGSSFSASTTSSAGASFSASATGVSATAGASSATSDTEAFACGLSTSFVAADGVSTAFVSSDSDSVSPPLVSALASTLVDVDSLPSSTACALTTVGDMKIQYPRTQDTSPTDSFLVPYLGLLLADFSFFFSINSLKFSNFTSTNIHHIFIRM